MMKQTAAVSPKTNENLAEALVSLGLRVPQVEHITGVSRTVVRAFYEKHHNRRSPSGLMPLSLTWYTESHEVSVHSAFFWMLFQHHYADLKRASAEAPHSALSSHAYCRALAMYQVFCKGEEVILTPERALRLVQHFADRLVLARSVRGDDTIKLLRCSTCETPLVVAVHYREYTCACCKDGRNPKKTH